MQASPRRPQQSLGPPLQIAAEPETAPTLVSPAKTEWDTWRLQLRERVRAHRVVFVALDFVLFLLPTRLAPRLKLTEAPCVSLSLPLGSYVSSCDRQSLEESPFLWVFTSYMTFRI